MGKLNIERLSHLTNTPQNTLNNLIFQSITLNKSQYFRVGHASISDELMNFRNPAICVQCLTESSYHRKYGQLHLIQCALNTYLYYRIHARHVIQYLVGQEQTY